MTEFFNAFSAALNWRLMGSVLLLVGLVLLVGYLTEKNKRARTEKPGRLLRYSVPGKTAAACRGILGKPAPGDAFLYKLEATPKGGWYFQLQQHRPTGQVLETLYLLAFEDDDPVQFSLRFVREAFGQKEPIVPPALLDEFFAAKLAAVPVKEEITA